MKQKIIALSIMLLAFSAGYAQSLHFGIKAGANINKLDGVPFSSQFTYGYHIGAFAEVGLGKNFSIEPEVLFNQVNVDSSDKFSSVYKFNNLSNVQLKYISIPILADYKLGKVISIQAGPQFGILIDQTKNLLDNGKDAFNKGDFSLVAGLQIKLVGLRVYGRYVVGLNNLNDTGKPDNWKGETIQVGVGFSFF